VNSEIPIPNANDKEIQPRLSVSMIVRNEEKYLADCLESVRSVADEIIVVDTGSTDRTIEIARGFGAQVFTFEWCDDYSSARNESLRHCTGEWVLYIDADERLGAGSSAEIRRLTCESSSLAFRCSIIGEEWLPNGKVNNIGFYPRLFRRLPEFCFSGRVHEQLVHSKYGLQYGVHASGVTIEHVGYQQPIEVIAAKCQRNIDLLKRRVREEPADPMIRYQLGNTLGIVGAYEEAFGELKAVLEMPSVPIHILGSTLNALASFLLAVNKPAEALVCTVDSIRIAPNQITALRLQASAYLALGEPSSALACVQSIRGMQHNPERMEKVRLTFDATISSTDLDYISGCCYADLAKWQLAAGSYFKAAMGDIYHEDVLDRYLNAELRRLVAGASQNELRQLVARYGTDVKVLNHLLGVYVTREDWDGFSIVAEFAATHSIHNDDTCVLMIQGHLVRGDIGKALAQVTQAEELGISSFDFDRVAMQAALKSRDLQRAVIYMEKVASHGGESAMSHPL
jgi:tetratricopeptide (TPR) repeat protein